MSLSRVGILYHPMVEAAYTLAGELEKLLSSRGVSVWLCSAWEEEEARARLDSTDLILTTGGDGTILRAAQLALPAQTPITGINLGRLGFMTELTTGEAVAEMSSLLEGKGWIDERALLEAELSPLEGGAPRICYALNDVVVARGTVTRVVYVDASIDGEPLTTYKGDGVIVATATGSTAYALAAGGPILHPRSEEFLLLPILPHLSSDYTLVLPPSAVVELHVTTAHQAGLSIDGHINLPLSSGATITVRHSVKKVRFLRVHPRASFYATLEKKLKGKR
ncbi:MAG: NAD(+)/NADH kinase [Chloroflexota bacterium]|nr:NAD(+)/NADH kinase [Chloroflexota bacterium]